MISHRITSSDLVQITGFTRHKLRNFLRELPGYSDTIGSERVAREYSMQDLVVIAICCALEEDAGMRRQVIGELAEHIRMAVTTPRLVSSSARLVICVHPVGAQYYDGDVTVAEGTVLPLKKILQRINTHVGGSSPTGPEGQLLLYFGPTILPNLRRGEDSFKQSEQLSAGEPGKVRANGAR